MRDALSLLDAGQDARVIELAAIEPRAKPLGPFAVVEIVESRASDRDAAKAQERGDFDALDLADFSEAVAAEPPPTSPPIAESVAEPPKKRRSKRAETADRVAPKVRRAGEPKGVAEPKAPKPPRWAPFHKRDLPKPRGRFTRVDVTKLKLHKLLEPQMKEELELLINQHGHRVAVRRALDPLYFGAKGEALTVSEVEGALLHHDLRRTIEERERTLVIAAVTEVRGDLGRAALLLGMRLDELDHVVLNCGAAAEIAKVREHHAREALAHGNVRHKLDLLDRQKYLADLGVEKRFKEALALELSELLDKAVEGATDLEGLIREVSKREALPYEKLNTAVEQTGLATAYRRRLVS
ncbi:MAG: hypothetical protein JNK82_09300 [Myxococcaceae bacterium]|nr:hypothetical protein [Myxococcaceae bacterium]